MLKTYFASSPHISVHVQTTSHLPLSSKCLALRRGLLFKTQCIKVTIGCTLINFIYVASCCIIKERVACVNFRSCYILFFAIWLLFLLYLIVILMHLGPHTVLASLHMLRGRGSFIIRPQKAKNPSVACVLITMCVEINSNSGVPPLPLPPPPPQQSSNRNMQTLNMKSEADHRKTFEKWHVPFMDKTHLAAAGFYFTNWGDVVCCAFCGVEVGQWEEGDNAFQDHQRWSPSC